MPRADGQPKKHFEMQTHFSKSVGAYLEAGWSEPLAVSGKKPPFKGTTGRKGKVTPEIIAQMKQAGVYSNIAIHHNGTVAIDVDEGDGKQGMNTFIELIAALGDPPATWSSSARGEGDPRKQYMYRLPGKKKRLELESTITPGLIVNGHRMTTGDVEIIQSYHRYSVVYPSVHPDTGEQYRWYDPKGNPSSRIPRVDELAELPQVWVDALIEAKKTAKSAERTLTAGGGVTPLHVLLCTPPQGDGKSQSDGQGRNNWLIKVAGHLAIRHRDDRSEFARKVREANALMFHPLDDGEVQGRIDSAWEMDQRNHPGAAPVRADAATAASAEPTREIPPIVPGRLAEVLQRVADHFRRYVVTTRDDEHDLFALWAAHTHTMSSWYTTPRLLIDSVMPNSGKTTVVEHMERLCCEPMQMTSITSPALLVRTMQGFATTLLIDEAEKVLKPDVVLPEVIATLNSGYKKGATRPVLAQNPESHEWEPVAMSTYAPILIAGNSTAIADDTRSRTIRVLLLPDYGGEAEESDWELIEADVNALGKDLADVMLAHSANLAKLRPEMPQGITGRMKEKWAAMTRIAHEAGGRWPGVVESLMLRDLQEVTAERAEGLQSAPRAVVFLRDLAAVWPKGETFLGTTEAVQRLIRHNADYWGQDDLRGRRALTVQGFGRIVFESTKVQSGSNAAKTMRGYHVGSFERVWRSLGITFPDVLNPSQVALISPDGSDGSDGLGDSRSQSPTADGSKRFEGEG